MLNRQVIRAIALLIKFYALHLSYPQYCYFFHRFSGVFHSIKGKIIRTNTPFIFCQYLENEYRDRQAQENGAIAGICEFQKIRHEFGYN
ncbi:hypothetical protein [Spirulina sp. 06S082]|uniref:hypothetical protein n=1 Tax=Spirulina sp. 06S082 TaxID=3110248 RepID=UPI002B21616D|nr:hypothetical protein [Spirulina sp. 06S082]MEA5471850.1 hypothetical protein [Spirulina sp. 06S082]